MPTAIVSKAKITCHLLIDQRSRRLLPLLEGRKGWNSRGEFVCVNSGHNIEQFKNLYPEYEFRITRDRALPEEKTGGTVEYVMKTKPYAHQQTAYDLCKAKEAYALFMDQGTGKSKVAIDKAGYLYLNERITGALVVSLKGVHRQWMESQIPLHMSEQVPWYAYAWDGKNMPETTKRDGVLSFFCTYIDALNTLRGEAEVRRFISNHNGRVLMIIDESHSIKNGKAARSKIATRLGNSCEYRMILTGTPIAKNVADVWSQFNFLDNRILGHKFFTTFKSTYCIMGGFQNKEIIGSRNVEALQSRMEPFAYRVAKDEALDLPPKIYNTWSFKMSDEQAGHYASLKNTFMTMFDNGEVVSVSNAAVLVTKLQQVVCGFMMRGEDDYVKLDNARIVALMELLDSLEGKAIIWARFTADIKTIAARLGKRCVTYYGDTSEKNRQGNVADFLDPNSEVRYFVANPAAGGTGLNLQGVCENVIYYSNSFNAVHRWQSEDRVHRIGMTAPVTYWDLVCQKSVDKRILENLRDKKDMSDLTLSELRKVICDD